MSATELSEDALRAIRSRKAANSVTPATPPAAEVRPARAGLDASVVRAFSQWFAEQRKTGSLLLPSESMLDVQASLSSRFSIGMHDLRYFIGIPSEIKDWFTALPWMHVAIPRGGSNLALVCESLRWSGGAMPAFALNFEVNCLGALRMLEHYHYLDVREVMPATKDEAAAGTVRIGRDVLGTFEIRIVTGARTFQSVLDGRKADSQMSRARGRDFGGERHAPQGVFAGQPGTFSTTVGKSDKQDAR